MVKREKSLVIVESPTKARTISAILGNDFEVVSSMGHVVDLPQKSLGIDIKDNFRPDFVVIPGKNKLLMQLKKEAKTKKHIYLATDPDREGEAIGWHIKSKIANAKDPKDKFLRVVFHEITKEAVSESFLHPQKLDRAKFDAQLARRILDRIVGYFLSPFLWRKLARGLSAGRVQSVALRIIVEREREIAKFTPQEYWEIEARLSKEGKEDLEGLNKDGIFSAKLVKIGKEVPKITGHLQAESIADEIKKEEFKVCDIKENERKRSALAPFTTSSLQQDAFNSLRFTARKTMIIAQHLYEGKELGKLGPTGLITYMRTDSVNVSQQALFQVRDFIVSNFGRDYLPHKPNAYKSGKRAQAAHEAIRPTLIRRKPQEIKQYLTEDEFKLYDLIWKRFLASQMKPAKILVTSVKISAGRFIFQSSGSMLKFEGFLLVYEDRLKKSKDLQLPPLSLDERLELIKLLPSQHFTKPPARFSDASLVKFLEERGIGRPSTYVPIIQTLLMRDYVRRLRGYFTPTELGTKVFDLLVKYFKKIMDFDFTARMEETLDLVEDGKILWSKVLEDFYPGFRERLDFAQEKAKKVVVKTKEVCSLCGRIMVIKWGRKGKFLSCSDYPKCKYSKAISTGVKCPNEGCGGELVERRSMKGRFFYGCSTYPKCTFVSNTLPQSEDVK
ncbi:MAG: type I DNA topoisomerase [Candidatus Omnitrophica bacterium]|nr:type I DNA topoisomerase [Candidatus Omnitrophota bacterium]